MVPIEKLAKSKVATIIEVGNTPKREI